MYSGSADSVTALMDIMGVFRSQMKSQTSFSGLGPFDLMFLLSTRTKVSAGRQQQDCKNTS